ncbi:MAG: sensor domain-containing protein [Polaromonas sp.]
MPNDPVRSHPVLSAARSALALQRAEQQLALAERIAGMGSWALELPGQQLTHSSQCAAILGFEASVQLTPEALLAAFVPEHRQRIGALLAHCCQHGVPFDEEMQIATPAGERTWVRAAGQAVQNRRGQIVGVQGMVQDIATQKRAQHETMRLAMRLTTTLASITEAFVTLDHECRLSYMNEESERLLLHRAHELLGKEVWRVLVSDKEQHLRLQLQKAIATQRRIEFEAFYPGLGKWLEVRAHPFAEGLAVYLRDVSTRRKSQEQLMLLETCIARLNDIVLITEAAPTSQQVPYIVFVNQAFEQQTGYSRQDMLGQTPRKLFGPATSAGEFQRIAAALKRSRQTRRELVIHRKDGSCFWLELEIVQVMTAASERMHWVAVGRDITQRKSAADAIHQLAFYDPLTSLPNRLLLMNRLEQVLAQSTATQPQGALMFVDVDKLKALNDTLGHHKGDLLLQQVATRLSSCVDDTATVARLGGDEFVVLLPDLGPDPRAALMKARQLAEKVLAQLREPFELGGHQHYTTSSIGVTPLTGGQTSVSDVLKRADLAMYQAKTLGRNNLCFFDPDMQAAINANAQASADLHSALKNQEFVLHYQPQVDRQGRITGVEALMRWRHPRRGLVMPVDFIPLAEESGLIVPLGQWALATACDQLAHWAGQPDAAHLSISVNVSARQFRDPEFVDRVMAEIRRTGIRAGLLKLELTESLLADGVEVTLARMGLLRALGVTLAMDDFGMGYSSLSMLKRLPLEQLKIDRSFIDDVLHDPADAAISRTIITLAHSLGLSVVAEGVETQAQLDFLLKEGCNQFQGFLFSRALPIEQLQDYFQAGWQTTIATWTAEQQKV